MKQNVGERLSIFNMVENYETRRFSSENNSRRVQYLVSHFVKVIMIVIHIYTECPWYNRVFEKIEFENLYTCIQIHVY